MPIVFDFQESPGEAHGNLGLFQTLEQYFQALPGFHSIYRADSGITEAGGVVMSWEPVLGPGRFLSEREDAEPVMTTREGTPAVKFSAAGMSHADALLGDIANWTILARFAATSPTDSLGVIMGQQVGLTQDFRILYQNDGTTAYSNVQNDTSSGVQSPLMPDNTITFRTHYWGATGADILSGYGDGNEATGTSSGAMHYMSELHLGSARGRGIAYPIEMELAGLALFTENITADQEAMTALKGYLEEV